MLEVAARLAETTLTQSETAQLKIQVFNGGARTVHGVGGNLEIRGPANPGQAPHEYGPVVPASKISVSPTQVSFGDIEPNQWSPTMTLDLETHDAARGDYMTVLHLDFTVTGHARAGQAVQIQVQED